MHYKTKPLAHQDRFFALSKDRTDFALFGEQGTGKTKMILDTAAYLFGIGEINTLLVVAYPNGVHRNWIYDQVPEHLAVAPNLYRAAVWESSMRAKQKKELDYALNQKYTGLRVIAMPVEAFSHKRAAAMADKLLTYFPCMMVIDESDSIKTPSAGRSRTLVRLGKKAKYTRITTGTPINNGPLDLYMQFQFLRLPILGLPNFQTYKNKFAEWETKINHKQNREYKALVSYRNLDKLKAFVDKHSFRVTKAECADLPDKVFEKVYVDMDPQQSKVYAEVQAQVRTQVMHGQLTAELAITRLLRAQQIVCGYVDLDDGTRAVFNKGLQERCDAVVSVCEQATHKVIIWTRFRQYIVDALTEALAERFGAETVCQYHGGVDDDEREQSKLAMQNPDSPVRYMVATRSASRGLTILPATTHVFHSNSFSYSDRVQMEDRSHRTGQTNKVTYIDIVCRDTVDEKLLAALRSKKNMADLITGDNAGEWI